MLGVSSVTGQGLDELAEALVALSGTVRTRDEHGMPRLPIDRAFSMRGFGTVVTGTLANGRIGVEQELELTPGARRVKVRGVQIHGASCDVVRAGQRAALNLAGIDVADVTRGQVLASPGTLPPRTVLDVAVSVLPSAARLAHGARVRFHEGTAETLARVSVIGPLDGEGAPPAIGPGETGFVRLRLESPAAVTRGDRFVLRRYSPALTIAGGQVLDPAPPRGGPRSPAAVARLERLRLPLVDGAGEEHALAVLVAEAGPRGLDLDELIARAGAGSSAGRLVVDRLCASPDIWVVGDRLLLRSWAATLGERVLAAVDAHHRLEPLSEGLPREELRERVLRDAHPAVAAAAIDAVIASGTLKGRDRIARSGHGVALSVEEDSARRQIVEAYRAAGLTPVDAAQVAASTGLALATVTQLSQLLVRQHELVKVDAFFYHHEVLERLKAEVRALKGTADAVDVGGFKERYGLTRKFAIPLLEYLDRERVTRRVGDRRVVL
jgi:selenocysteine-specific elongation factor